MMKLKMMTLVVALASVGSHAYAQYGGSTPANTIQANGVETVKLSPTTMRLTIVLSGRGKTLKDATAALGDCREAAVLQLEKLGAGKESIKSTDPALGGTSERQQQMMKMYAQQMRGRREVPKGLQVPKSFTLTTTLTADWALQSEDRTETLAFTKDLEAKIAKADLAGLNEPQKLSPEEQEMQEEMAEMASNFGYSDEEAKPGEPNFSYQVTMTKEQQAAAMKAAFAKAKASAESLANAADVKLGKLSTLSGTVVAQDASSQQRYAMMGMYGGESSDGADERRGSSTSFAPVNFTATIQAGFSIGE